MRVRSQQLRLQEGSPSSRVRISGPTEIYCTQAKLLLHSLPLAADAQLAPLMLLLLRLHLSLSPRPLVYKKGARASSSSSPFRDQERVASDDEISERDHAGEAGHVHAYSLRSTGEANIIARVLLLHQGLSHFAMELRAHKKKKKLWNCKHR